MIEGGLGLRKYIETGAIVEDPPLSCPWSTGEEIFIKGTWVVRALHPLGVFFGPLLSGCWRTKEPLSVAKQSCCAPPQPQWNTIRMRTKRGHFSCITYRALFWCHHQPLHNCKSLRHLQIRHTPNSRKMHKIEEPWQT